MIGHAVLQQQVADNEKLASLLMANVDEFAILIRFLRELNACESPRQVADALFTLVDNFRLDTVIQLRASGNSETYTANDLANPLAVSIIRHVRGMGRIVGYKSRLACNHPLVTLLINNMPVADGELCGRLRDHLAVAVESADSRLEALQVRADKASTSDSILLLLETLQTNVAEFSRRYDCARYQGSTLTQMLANELTEAFAHQGMSIEHEARILEIVQGRAHELIDLYDFGDELQSGLLQIQQHLRAMLVPFG